jgi:ribulose-bisphosphate carboxylase large chain
MGASISAVYHVATGRAEAERIARWIAVEQTVEAPDELLDARIEEEIVGSVVSIDALADGRHAVRIDYRVELAAGQLPQLLNLVYGNVSLFESVRLVELDLPAELLSRFRGPNLGGPGLRRLLGVYGRPLLSTALKPRGRSEEELAAMAGEFALGGGDLVKDDHNLVDDYDAFRRRIRLGRDAVARANERTGRNCLYVPNLCAPAEQLPRFVEYVLDLGLRGVMVAPLILGLDTVRHLTARYPLFVIAHPSFGGTFYRDPRHGIAPHLLLGTLYRLAGIDVSILVSHGGRFHFPVDECIAVAEAVRAPLGSLEPGLPCPAGGMRYERIPELAREYGPETLILVGGALLGHTTSVRASTESFLERIREQFDERCVAPQTDTKRGLA